MNPPCRLGILGNPEGWYVRDLQRAGIQWTVEVLSFADLSVELGPNGEVQARTKSWTNGQVRRLGGSHSDLDVLLVRMMPLGSVEQIIFRMNALQVAEKQGMRIVNSPRSLEIAIDKWLTLETCRQSGLLVPETIACQTREQAMEAWAKLGGDCVVKPLFGSEGKGMLRAEHHEMAWRIFGNLELLGAVIYLQRFVPNEGADLRLLVVGDDLFSVRRSNRNDWRSNVSCGGEATRWTPTDSQRDMAYAAAKAIGAQWVGVDLLPSLEGRDYLLEVNAVPGWRATAKAWDVDMAAHVLKWLRETHPDDSESRCSRS